MLGTVLYLKQTGHFRALATRIRNYHSKQNIMGFMKQILIKANFNRNHWINYFKQYGSTN